MLTKRSLYGTKVTQGLDSTGEFMTWYSTWFVNDDKPWQGEPQVTGHQSQVKVWFTAQDTRHFVQALNIIWFSFSKTANLPPFFRFRVAVFLRRLKSLLSLCVWIEFCLVSIFVCGCMCVRICAENSRPGHNFALYNYFNHYRYTPSLISLTGLWTLSTSK